ncbi:MAG TPA: BrnT family toxin [Bryobacteraceae bacterium]|nr:BrnT family toxin [Bryobacteraceae bacterium]
MARLKRRCYARLVGFAWDPRKAKRNLAKHGVSFDDATAVFDDELFLVFADPDHSAEESRFIIMGRSKRERLLVVAYTERSDEIRIISAREATRQERKIYAEEI